MTLLLASLLAPAAALADTHTHYYLQKKGMCNKTEKTVTISYEHDGGVGHVHEKGITKDKKGRKLAPGACAEMSFRVYGSSVDQGASDGWITFYVNNGYQEMGFDGKSHRIHRGKRSHPTGYEIEASSGHHSHFHIDINRRVVAPNRPNTDGSGKSSGGDSGGDSGGESGGSEDVKKDPKKGAKKP